MLLCTCVSLGMMEERSSSTSRRQNLNTMGIRVVYEPVQKEVGRAVVQFHEHFYSDNLYAKDI